MSISTAPRASGRTSLRFAATLATFALVFSACSSAATQAPASESAAASASAAPASESAAPASSAAAGGAITFGSNESDATPKAAVKALVDYCSQQTGISVTINTTDHNTFQNQISSYLQAKPEDVVKWFAGHRLRFFADQGLLTDISDVWQQIGSDYTDAFKAASTGNDGKQYLIPLYNYPWVVLYRKSVFQAHNYTVPKTIDDFIALAKKMKADGLVPLAFGDKDGWPAMGTFDILDMRMNGYQFHIDLLNGKQKWTDPKVLAVFQKWAELMPYFEQGALGRTWQEAAQDMVNKKAGMYFLGTFASQQATDPAALADLDFFPFPTLGTQYDSEMAIDAPIDGLMLSKAPSDVASAKKFLACAASGPAEAAYVKIDGSIAAAKDADTSGYTPLQAKSQQIIASAGKIAQFLDRDARSDFAGPQGMQNFLAKFLNAPNGDLTKLLSDIQAYYDSLPPEN
jgi:multiple sugar transport system substrate-binding protein